MKLSRALGLVFSLLAGSAGSAEARTRTYLIVIAENDSLDPKVPALEYADDDGAKNWELFSLYADRASLFAIFDEETARLHSQAARQAEVPDKNAILARLGQYNTSMEKDVERGDEPELFLLYAGHGDVDERGEGYVTLHDGKLTRSELYREIIAPSKARFVHVVVDACKSYFLVKSRGKGKVWRDDSASEVEGVDDAVRALLGEEALDHFPRAGVIVATSGDKETHEWSRYRGGILSHELRSALSGAADVNADRRIEYSEVRAFLAAANARVRNPGVRLDTFARPPQLDRNRALIDLSRVPESGGSRLIHFPAKMSGHFSIEDERGVRYADVNKDLGTAFDVLLPAGRAYFVRRDEIEESEILPDRGVGGERVDAGELRWHRLSFASRGAVENSFRQDLYRVPYGRSFYDGFVATSGDLPVDDGGRHMAAFGGDGGGHRVEIGYLATPSPAGEAGLSHGAVVRYGYLFEDFDAGVLAELGYGAGAGELQQQLKRVAILAAAGYELQPVDRLGIHFSAAAGWQLLSGVVVIDGKRLEGTEGKGLRAEASGGLSWALSDVFSMIARGGVALDGVFSDSATSLRAQPFFTAGLSASFR